MSADDAVAAREVTPGEAAGSHAAARAADPGEAADREVAARELDPSQVGDEEVAVRDVGAAEAAGSDVGDGVDAHDVDANGAADQRMDAHEVDAREPDTAEMVFGRPPTRPGDRPSGGAEVAATRAAVADTAPLIQPDQLEALQRRWGTAQAGFVDDPRRAVEVADEVVATALAALQSAVEDRLAELSTWRDDANATTDVLLAAFRGYRTVFERVMSA